MIIMKKLTSLLIGCSLALTGAALAQQPVEEQSPAKGKRAPEKAHPAQAQPKPNAAKPQAPAATQHEQHGAMKQQGATHQPSAIPFRPTMDRSAYDAAKAREAKKQGVAHEHAPSNEPGAGKSAKASAHQESGNAPATGTDASGHAAGMPTQKGKEQQVQERKQGQGVKQPATEAGAAPPASA